MFTGPNAQGFGVQKVAIGRDAKVVEADVDSKGGFSFRGLAAGKYYLYFRCPDNFQGDDWLYQYTAPRRYVLQLAGYMYRPVEHDVAPGRITTVPDIELTRRIEPSDPVPATSRGDILTFAWPQPGPGKYSRITIEHQEYEGSLRNASYGSHEVRGAAYDVPATSPLHHGKHRFQVEVVTSTDRIFAKSDWKTFVVPGDVLFLRVQEDRTDPSHRTVTWFGSDTITAVKVTAEDWSTTTNERTLKLPTTVDGRRLVFQSLSANGRELIPGWEVFHWQSKQE